MNRRSRARIGTFVLAVLALTLLGVGSSPVAVGATGNAGHTETGKGRFSDLKVTVSQTEHLRNQVVAVTWSGFEQTTELTGSFSTNYLQIMQCWGGADEPERETCQFGGLINDTRGGFASASRQVSYGSGLVDPEETYKQPPGSFEAVRVPFDPVNGEPTDEVKNGYFDQYSTNEVPFVRSSAEGTGTEYVEIQTAREAPGLGCGAATADGPRPCWLVVVPRDDVEVSGQHAQNTDERRLISSPLSASNWKSRIAFRLSFDPIAVSCPIGAAEQRLLGHEEISEAIVSWQPALCGATGSIFGFSQLGDTLARNQVLGDKPWLSMVADPVEPERITDGRMLTYAPVGISGIGIAFNIDRVPALDAPGEVQQKRGTKVGDLKLNARLVAKLLTQSYNLAALSRPDAIAGNPLTLSDDPEFLALNPEFKDLAFMTIRQITNPLGLSDANRALWSWVAANQDARDFVAGKPDQWGMRVNPAYQGMTLDREDFPRADSGCRAGPEPGNPLCPLDALAYAADFHEAGRGAARGDTLERANWESAPPGWKKNVPQLSGERQVLALVDTATAARYQLPMAALVNAAGQYVSPTEESMTAALGGLKKTGVTGVEVTDPAYQNASAYPLTSISYAVTAPRLLEVAEAKAYAGFLRFVTTDGQVRGIGPGQLPEGYVPLTAAMRKLAAEAADLIEMRGGPLVAPDPTASDDASAGDGAGAGTGAGTGAPIGPVAAPVPGSVVPVGAPAAGAVVPLSSRTPSAPAGGARFLLVAALVLGVGVALGRPTAPLVRHLLKRGAGAP